MDWRALRDALIWRRTRIRRRWRPLAAYIWRRLLIRTTVIAVSGSVGKTTTKELLRTILEDHAPTAWSPGNDNLRKFGSPEATLLRARPRHQFIVVEAGVERPGDMASVIKLLKPDIGVMLDVKRCHTNTFKTIENLAAEKAELVRNLGAGSRVVLNLDNPHVAAMADAAPCEVIAFGSGTGARFRLLEARSRWPERLTLLIQLDGARYEVKTRLVGVHWATAVMAALTTAVVCGVPVEKAIAAIATVEPFWARMQPVALPGSGAVMIRDEWNGSVDTFEAAFKVMEEARAERKIVVVSDYSDTPSKLRTRANRLGRRGAEVADLLVFVGDYADRSVAAAVTDGFPQENARSAESVQSAVALLKSELRSGDLVLLKGQTSHHLSRIYLGLLGDIACSRMACSRQILCDACEHLGLAVNQRSNGLVYCA